MTQSATALLYTAATIGTLHTLIGIDHYVPFVALSKSNGWTMKKTMAVVFVCGIGHVLSSILLGALGIGLSIGVSSLVDIEGIRGELATWFLVAFGLVYMIWGIRQAYMNRPHRHISPDGHAVEHVHSPVEHMHKHDDKSLVASNAVWGLFILLVLGPCEPLIPILMYPAATHNPLVLFQVTACFAACTIATMMCATFVGLKGIDLLRVQKLERYSHGLAGFAVLVCGLMLLLFDI